MKTNEMHLVTDRRPPSIGRTASRSPQVTLMRSGLLGLACVAGVFAVLGLLYSIG